MARATNAADKAKPPQNRRNIRRNRRARGGRDFPDILRAGQTVYSNFRALLNPEKGATFVPSRTGYPSSSEGGPP
jgi:hypothetical protein